MPATTQIIAGVACESGTLAEQQRALDLVDVAAGCGIARGRSVPASRLVMRCTAELAATSAGAHLHDGGQPTPAWA